MIKRECDQSVALPLVFLVFTATYCKNILSVPALHHLNILVMPTKSLLLSLSLLFAITTLTAQKEETLLGPRNLGFSGFWFGSSFGWADLAGQSTYIPGWQVEFEFGKALRIGFGGYHLHDNIRLSDLQYRTYDIDWKTFNLG